MSNTKNDRANTPDGNPANRDAITGEPGSHPVATGAGAAAGGVVGGVAGSVAGPIGTGIGAAIGATAGGLAGKAVGEKIDPTEEDRYWRSTFSKRPYAGEFRSYEDVAPAYRYGWESAARNRGKSFKDSESDLRDGWENTKDKAELTWEKAKLAVKDAWDRITPDSDSPRDRAPGRDR